VRLGGPKTTGQKLHLSGFAPGELFQGGPIHLTVIADGEALSTFTLEAKDNEFDLTAEMPARSLGRIETLITLQTDRIYIPPGDGRKLSLAFGKFRIQ
jgi:hypothetical protein